MTRMLMSIRGLICILALVLCSATTSQAGDYPNRPIQIVVPFGPGGTSDLSVRFLAEKWQEFLGQPVVILNKPGAGSAVGARFVAESKPDGYTLLLGSDSPLVVVRIMNKNLGYDLDSFTYLFGYASGAVYFVDKSDSPMKSMADVIAAAKKEPGKMTYATHGVGSLSNFIAEALWKETGVKIAHVPFKASPEANAAVLGGHVNLAVPPSIGDLARNGNIRVLAVTSKTRVPYAPNVPTLNELGYKTNLVYYSLLVGPKGLPDEVKAKLISAQQKAYEKYGPEISATLNRLELVPAQLTGEQAKNEMREHDKWFRDLAGQMGLTN